MISNNTLKGHTLLRKRAFSLILLSIFMVQILLIPSFINADKKKVLPKNSVKLYVEDYYELLMMVEDSVKLPLKEYNSLLELIRKVEEERKKEEERLKKLQQMTSAQKYTVSSGEMTCIVRESAVDANLSLKINLLKEGWKEIPLALLPTLEKVLINSHEMPLQRTSNDQYTIFTEKTGFADVLIRFHPEIKRNTMGRHIYNRFRIEFNQRATTEIKIILPAGAEPTRDCIKKYNFKKREGIWQALFKADFTMPLEVVWFVPRKEIEMVEEKIEYSGNLLSFFIFDERTIRYISLIKVEMLGGLQRQIKLDLPDDYSLVDKELSNGISIDYDRKSNEIDLSIAPNFNEAIQLILSLEKKRESESIKIQPIFIKGAKRQYGHVALRGEGLRVKVKDAGSFEGIDTRLLPFELRGLTGTEPEKGFKYNLTQTKPAPIAISFEKIKTAESLPAYIKSMNYTVVASREGIGFTEAEINVINNNKQFLEIGLPSESQLQNSFVDGKPVKPVKKEKGTVMIPIRPKKHTRDGLVKVGFVYKTKRTAFLEDGDRRIDLPKLNLPVNDLRCRLYLPEGYEYEDFGGSFKIGTPAYVPPLRIMLGALQEKSMEKDETERLYLREEIKTKDTSTVSFAGALPLRIKLPKIGKKFDFYDLLVIDEKPFISFEYEIE